VPPRDPVILAIETSNPSAGPGSVAFGPVMRVDGHAGGTPEALSVLGLEPLREPTRHDDDLLPAIDRLARRLGLVPRDIARVAVSIGPGGYTACRTATAAGKMIAEAVGARCVAVPTPFVAARGVAHEFLPAAVCLASKHEATFVTVIGVDGRPAGPGRLVKAGDVRLLEVRAVSADRYLPSSIADSSRGLGVVMLPLRLDAAACWEASLGLPEVDAAALNPAYPREPDAVTQWRLRRGSGGQAEPGVHPCG
jgi:tRNA A37 threonylcarbamoyladenosine modification protein TsaB